MRRNIVGIACAVVALAAVVATQGTGAMAISGSWASDSRTLLELAAGERGAVSGTVFFYQGQTRRATAPIKAGRFDSQTRRLTLTGEVTLPEATAAAPYRIEGVLEQDTLRVTLTVGGDFKGTQTLVRVAAQ